MVLVVATITAAVVVAAVASMVVVAVAVDVATSPTISAKATMAAVVAITPPAGVQAIMVGLFVRFASRKDTLQIGVGTGLRRIMFLKRSMHPRP
jgi:putative ubiquitin-RnfH superfamily antitoxin RatB of RatAB toxin-antitoxin module